MTWERKAVNVANAFFLYISYPSAEADGNRYLSWCFKYYSKSIDYNNVIIISFFSKTKYSDDTGRGIFIAVWLQPNVI